MAIHPSAVVEPGARIHASAEIGPFCIVGPRVSIGPGTKLLHSVVVTGRTSIGARNVIHPFAVLGGDPQDLKYKGEDSVTVIGDENVIREHVTINKGTQGGGSETIIGHRNLIMATAHVAHDTVVENHCVIANAVLLAGHVRIESWVILSGWVCIHHFVTIGQHAFIGGASRINQDVPPFMITQGLAGEVKGVNSVGLRRRGFKPDAVNALRDAHRILWRSGLPKQDALAELARLYGEIPELRTLMEFLKASDFGRMGRAREPGRGAPPPDPESDLLE
jgi:UDP-N-acetylglucosamine acyltransferase